MPTAAPTLGGLGTVVGAAAPVLVNAGATIVYMNGVAYLLDAAQNNPAAMAASNAVENNAFVSY